MTGHPRVPDEGEHGTADPAEQVVIVPAASQRLSVWATAQQAGPSQRKGRYVPASSRHPGRMLPAIARHAITTYTRPGDLVLDPMCGIGTTLVEAIHSGRDAVGVEYETQWAHLAATNVEHARTHGASGRSEVLLGDARELDTLIPAQRRGKISLVVTSPPYGPSTHGQVSALAGRGVRKSDHRYGSPHNLAYRPTGELLDGFTTILAACRGVLRPGGHVVITARPWRRNGELVDLPSAVLAAGRDAGLIPVERCVALLAAVRNNGLVARASFFQLLAVRNARAKGIPLHVIGHEDVLIFRTPETCWSSGKLKQHQQKPHYSTGILSHLDSSDTQGAAA